MPTARDVDQSDLQLVRGVGPKVEACLKSAGIGTLAELARTPVNELVAVSGLYPRFDAARITREKWLAQAARLAVTASSPPMPGPEVVRVRHNFTVEVQLAAVGGKIVSSKIVHVQTNDEKAWAGWDGPALIAFIEHWAHCVPSEVSAPRAPQPSSTSDPDAALALRAFAVVDASRSARLPEGAMMATVTVPTAGLKSLRSRTVAVSDLYLRQTPPAKSRPLGRARAEVDPGQAVRLEVAGILPPAARASDVFAAVRILSHGKVRATPSNLRGARLDLAEA